MNNPECQQGGPCFACSVENHENEHPKHYQQKLECPQGCKVYRMHQSMNSSNLDKFTIDKNGNLLPNKDHPFGQVIVVVAELCVFLHLVLLFFDNEPQIKTYVLATLP